ncbi:MAG: hypothetical protein GWP59_02100 [Chlamydiales bacterium]|nr:hypothetical protein [Chlamydiales bacterium]NCF70472.1 hypothetical protein [Chlamydiales bacterium]
MKVNWLKVAVISAFVLYFSVFAMVFYVVNQKKYSGVTNIDVGKVHELRWKEAKTSEGK